MNFTERFKQLSNQHMEEQALLSDGIAFIKDCFKDKKATNAEVLQARLKQLNPKPPKQESGMKL